MIETRDASCEVQGTKLEVFDHEVVVVLTRTGYVIQELRARRQARVARVRVVGGDDHVEYRSIELIAIQECVLLVVEHLTAAVRRRILLVR